MSALADFAHKIGSESRELKIGQSFFNDADSVFHTIRYDFVPASVDPNKTSALDIGPNGKVTVTMPNLEGSGTTESVYQGQRKPHQKECVLIINNETGDIILEKLNTSMIVKKARLRQEDLTGKSLALNKNATPGSNSASHNSSGSSNALSQSKSSINDSKKTTGSSLKSSQGAKHQKTSPPLSTANLTNSSLAQPRSNGFQPKTPSPPSMPIFIANKGSLLRSTNGSANATSNEPNADWNGSTKSKESGKSKLASQANRLSDESSSEGGNSDEESSSSQSSDSSSEDEMASEKTTTASNLRSMPSLSMPTSLVALSGLTADPVPQANKSPSLLNQANDLKKSALSLSLSEDSDSSDDESTRKHKKISNGTGGFSKAVNNNIANGKIDSVQKNSTFTPDNSKSFQDSMPKFSNGTSATATYNSMPKYSQLSQDLQLSESSGSDSDD